MSKKKTKTSATSYYALNITSACKKAPRHTARSSPHVMSKSRGCGGSAPIDLETLKYGRCDVCDYDDDSAATFETDRYKRDHHQELVNLDKHFPNSKLQTLTLSQPLKIKFRKATPTEQFVTLPPYDPDLHDVGVDDDHFKRSCTQAGGRDPEGNPHTPPWENPPHPLFLSRS